MKVFAAEPSVNVPAPALVIPPLPVTEIGVLTVMLDVFAVVKTPSFAVPSPRVKLVKPLSIICAKVPVEATAPLLTVRVVDVPVRVPATVLRSNELTVTEFAKVSEPPAFTFTFSTGDPEV